MGDKRWRGLVMLCVLVATATRAHAAAGDPDPSFGTGGAVTTDFGNAPDAPPVTQAANAVVVQPDGKIVVAGFVVRPFTAAGFGLLRYDVDGVLDPTFGDGGKVLTAFAQNGVANALLLQPDGRLIAGGWVDVGFGENFGLARYDTDGTLDATFGTGGIALGTFDSNLNLQALARQPDGKIVAVGYDQTFGTVIALARFDPDGTLDPGFGPFGWVETSFGPDPQHRRWDDARGVAIQPDGKIVVVGTTFSPSVPDGDFQLVRYLPNGTLDPTFGVGGRVRTDVGGAAGADNGRSVQLLPDGRIVAIGLTAGGAIAVVRYEPDGDLDLGFGIGGKVVTEVVQQSTVTASLLLPDGKLIVAGSVVGEDFNLGYDFAVLRYEADGSLDAGFGNGGVAQLHISHPGPSIETANALAVQPDGKIVAAGYVHEPFAMYPNFVYDFAVVRFLGDCGNGTLDGVEACDAGAANGTASSCCAVTCAFRVSGDACRPAVDVCDTAETCTGASGSCPPDAKETTATACRIASDACDLAEHCDGVTDACPADGLAPAGSECRPIAGPCDVAEQCSGTGSACPADGFAAATIVCRPSAGACDRTDRCDGTAAACPPDEKEPMGTTCRTSAAACDVADACDGVSDGCPADAFAASGTPCRDAAGECDVAEVCTGATASCPADTGLPDSDGDGTCDAQDACPDVADPAQVDTDADGTGDACDPCTNGAPATKPKLTATKLLAPAGDDTLVVKGVAVVPPTPALDPLGRGVRILVTTASGRTVVDASVPGGVYDPVAKTGWKTNGGQTAWKYRGPGVATAGIEKVAIGRTSAGAIKASVKGRHGAYAVTAAELPVTATVVLDVPAAAGGQCIVVSFPAAAPVRPSCTLVGGATLRCK